MNNLKVAAVCMKAQPHKIDRNLGRIKSFAQEAADQRVDIICFPELSVTGYILDNATGVYTESISKEIIERICTIARETGLVMLVGMIEKAGRGKPFISQVIAGPKGIMGVYRKTHLSPPEKESYRPGQDIKTYSINHTIFGVQLCYEAHFPEISTKMALNGAEVIFIPHASPRGSPDEKIQSWLRHLPARAFDNSVFIVACNQVGKYQDDLPFPGVCIIMDPTGKVIGQYCGDQEKMTLVDLKRDVLDEVRQHRMKHFLPHRRPELY